MPEPTLLPRHPWTGALEAAEHPKCLNCGGPIVFRENERGEQRRRRKYCSVACGDEGKRERYKVTLDADTIWRYRGISYRNMAEFVGMSGDGIRRAAVRFGFRRDSKSRFTQAPCAKCGEIVDAALLDDDRKCLAHAELAKERDLYMARMRKRIAALGPRIDREVELMGVEIPLKIKRAIRKEYPARLPEAA